MSNLHLKLLVNVFFPDIKKYCLSLDIVGLFTVIMRSTIANICFLF